MNIEEIKHKLFEAESCLTTDQFFQALQLCEEILGDDSIEQSTILQAQALRFLSKSLFRTKRATEALPYAEQALALAIQANDKAELAVSYENLALVHHDLSNFHRAIELLNEARTLSEELGLRTIEAGIVLYIGNSFASLTDYIQALSYFIRSLGIYEEIHLQKEAARVKGNIGFIYTFLGAYDKALDYYTQALAVNEEFQMDSESARNMGGIASIYRNQAEFPLALEYYSKALAIHERTGNREVASVVIGNIGNVYNSISDYSRALECYAKALSIHEELGMKADATRVKLNMGSVYLALSDYSRTLELYNTALLECEALGKKDVAAAIIGNLGTVYRDLADLKRALEYYNRAATFHEEAGDKSGLATIMGNIGLIYMRNSDFTRALEYLSKSLDLHQALGTKGEAAKVLGNIGNVYGSISEYSQALDYFEKALLLHEELGMKFGIGGILRNMGFIYSQEKFDGYDPKIAEDYYLNGLSSDIEVGSKLQIYEAHEAIALLYKKQGNWKAHSNHFEKFHDLYIEVQTEDAKEQAQLMEHRRKLEESERDRQIKLARFQEQEKILHNILPAQLAERMVAGEKTIADSHEHVSVFFSDIVGFTKFSQQISAEELVKLLNGIFTEFDRIARKHGLEKIKTIGDAYMAVAGAPVAQDNHAERAALFAVEVSEFMNSHPSIFGITPRIRIGLHTGSVIAGVIGESKFAYDLWGDAVNTASRMESHGEPGKIHVTEEFMHAFMDTDIGKARDLSLQVKNVPLLQFTSRGEMDIKGKGRMTTYFLENTNSNL